MYKQEEINPYHAGEKSAQVEEMFDNIAPTYDKLNHRLSWDIDRGWRRKAIQQLVPHTPKKFSTSLQELAILPSWQQKCYILKNSSVLISVKA